MSTWLTVLVTLASLAGTGGGLAVLVGAFTGRRTRGAEVADRLSDSSLKWVQEFQEESLRARAEAQEARREAQEARRETSEARREMAELRREMATVMREAEAMAAAMRNLHGAIMHPAATLDRLRAMVGGDGVNGRM